MRVRWKALVPAAGVLVGILSDPKVLALMPETWSHVIVGISAVAAVLFPALVTDKPKTPDPKTRVQYVPPPNVRNGV